MFKFSNEVEGFLTAAGWHTGRKIDTVPLVAHLLEKEYVVSKEIESFLQEFGQLNISFLLLNKNVDHLHFDVTKAINDINPLWIKDDYAKRLNNNGLCVIGQAYANHLTLMMDNAGRMYGGYDDNLYFIAESGEEAIQVICLNQQLKEIL